MKLNVKEPYLVEYTCKREEGYTHFYMGEKDEQYGEILHILGPTNGVSFIPDEYRTIEGLLCLDAGSRPVVATIRDPFDNCDKPERYVCKDHETAELYRACVVRNAMENLVINNALTRSDVEGLWQLAQNFMEANFTEMENENGKN